MLDTVMKVIYVLLVSVYFSCIYIYIYVCVCVCVFQLVPPNKVKQQIPALPNALAPAVGVSVVLRKEDMVSALTFL